MKNKNEQFFGSPKKRDDQEWEATDGILFS